MYIQI